MHLGCISYTMDTFLLAAFPLRCTGVAERLRPTSPGETPSLRQQTPSPLSSCCVDFIPRHRTELVAICENWNVNLCVNLSSHPQLTLRKLAFLFLLALGVDAPVSSSPLLVRV